MDPHSHARPQEARITHLDLDIDVDMQAERIRGVARYAIAASPDARRIVLDTDGLTIERVAVDGREAAYTLGDSTFLGRPLEVSITPGAKEVAITYATGPQASALQWLKPQQTAGKRQPFLFTQGQAILTRSWIPIQDSPGIRLTYAARVRVPQGLMAVMSAENPTDRSASGEYSFRMEQPIPAYLIALAVGDIAFQPVGQRTGVYAEPSVVEKAAWEFADMERMLETAEQLYGPYRWGRYDVIVLPPSFPFGGMENPRLTFLTPALLAGDRSQVNVVAHELAHSWTGNLVTNSNAEHFWLNEGFTVFAERRILEALEGPEMVALHAAIGFEELQQAFAQHAKHPELTKLRTHLAGVDPDEAFSQVPYEKGYLFLKTLEAAAGREAFDRLLRTWLGEHRFGAATTDDFLATAERVLPGLLVKVDAKAWIDAPGLPPAHWKPESARLAAVQKIGARVPTRDESKAWSPTEWHLWLEAMPKPSPVEVCRALDEQYALTASKNPEVLVAWLVLACESGYAPVLPRVEELLGRFGRMKYLKPLYRALAARPETKQRATGLFARYRGQYHPIAQQVLANLLGA